MMSDLSGEYENENAYDSIRFKCEFGLNVSDESEKQVEKQCDPRISISEGIRRSDDFEKLRINL
jgi:hypothetical protein